MGKLQQELAPLPTGELIKLKLMICGQISGNLNKWLHIRHLHANYKAIDNKLLYTKLIPKQMKVEYHVLRK